MGKEKVRNSMSEIDYNKKEIILAQNLPKYIIFEFSSNLHFFIMHEIMLCTVAGQKEVFVELLKVTETES